MSPGANLSHSARLFGEAQRIYLAAILHLEAADLVVPDIDKLLATAGITEDDIADALELLGSSPSRFSGSLMNGPPARVGRARAPSRGGVGMTATFPPTWPPLPKPWQNGTAAARSPTPKFRLVQFDDLRPGAEAAYLVKGLIPRVGLTVAWGPPKCGKSFWTFDLAMHVALGGNTGAAASRAGLSSTAPSRARTGSRRERRRSASFTMSRRISPIPPVPFYLSPSPIDLVADSPALIGSIRAQLRRGRPGRSSCSTRSTVRFAVRSSTTRTCRPTSAPPTRSATPSPARSSSCTIAESTPPAPAVTPP